MKSSFVRGWRDSRAVRSDEEGAASGWMRNESTD
jgi:hypothetical protein